MDLVRFVEEKILSVVNEISKFFEGEIDYLTFEAQLKEELDGIGRTLVQLVLETLEEKIHENEERKREWKVVRRRDQKAVLTPFGQLTYERSYYQHKESKNYAYLVDEQIGVTPHARIGHNLKAALLEASSKMSYEEATVPESSYNPELKVSRQTVALTVKKFTPVKSPSPQEKWYVRALYIEADEDHVRIRDHKRKKPSLLIYVHEGVSEEGSRRRLKNAKYFTKPWGKSKELWREVLDYLEARYDLSKVERIYLLGDGASWIRTGLEHLPPQTIFILDKYHLEKYIQTATAHAPGLKMLIHRGIKSFDPETVLGNASINSVSCRDKRSSAGKTEAFTKRKLLGVENIDNVPLLRGGHNLTRMALKRLIEHNAVV